MLENQELLEPIKCFNEMFDKQKNNTQEYFNLLHEQSKVDEVENKETCRLYDEESELIEGLNKELNKYNIFKWLCISAAILGVLFIGISIFCFVDEVVSAGIGFVVPGCLLVLVGPIIYFTLIKSSIEGLESQIADHKEVANKILNKAYDEMRPLNDLFTEKDSFNIMSKTMPEFQFNNCFTRADEAELINEYNMVNILGENCSVIATLSGKFCGNPFLYFRYKQQDWGQKVYTGSLTIYWTEEYTDSEGNTHSVQKSEVLHASITRPIPEYSIHTALGYGNQCAPDLTFSREFHHAEDYSEKKLERKVKSGEKKLEKQARKATSQGGNFQEMANSEFDVLFGANDRDNEVQFRTMFTPLAQTNMVRLLTDKSVGYGDDFCFYKYGKYNILVSEHSSMLNLNTSPINYQSYSFDVSKSSFENINYNFFKNIYFDFAPFMSIPAYMDAPIHALEGYYEYDSNYTTYEYETVANEMGYTYFQNPESVTESILKSKFIHKDGKRDIVNVVAHSFTTIERIEYVPVLGGDGDMHDVPVVWYEYIPVYNSKNINVGQSDTEDETNKLSQEKALNIAMHGLFAYMIM